MAVSIIIVGSWNSEKWAQCLRVGPILLQFRVVVETPLLHASLASSGLFALNDGIGGSLIHVYARNKT
jgi:hypothetical protein